MPRLFVTTVVVLVIRRGVTQRSQPTPVPSSFRRLGAAAFPSDKTFCCRCLPIISLLGRWLGFAGVFRFQIFFSVSLSLNFGYGAEGGISI